MFKQTAFGKGRCLQGRDWKKVTRHIKSFNKTASVDEKIWDFFIFTLLPLERYHRKEEGWRKEPEAALEPLRGSWREPASSKLRIITCRLMQLDMRFKRRSLAPKTTSGFLRCIETR